MSDCGIIKNTKSTANFSAILSHFSVHLKYLQQEAKIVLSLNTKPPTRYRSITTTRLYTTRVGCWLCTARSRWGVVPLSLNGARSAAEVIRNEGGSATAGARFGFLLLHMTGVRTDQRLQEEDEATQTRVLNHIQQTFFFYHVSVVLEMVVQPPASLEKSKRNEKVS